MKCMMRKMKMICRNGRTKDIPGHHQELLQFMGMGVESREATHLGVIARKKALTFVMEMMTGPMALAVAR